VLDRGPSTPGGSHGVGQSVCGRISHLAGPLYPISCNFGFWLRVVQMLATARADVLAPLRKLRPRGVYLPINSGLVRIPRLVRPRCGAENISAPSGFPFSTLKLFPATRPDCCLRHTVLPILTIFSVFSFLVFGDSSEFWSHPVIGADTSACVNARAVFVQFRMFFVRRILRFAHQCDDGTRSPRA
jgi:hypothetical protein